VESSGGIDARRVVQVATVLSQDLGPGAVRSGLRGSGYQISTDAVLTAAHVLKDAISVMVRFVKPDGSSRQYIGHVVFLDEDADVAVVKIADGDDLDEVRPVAFGRIDQPARCEAIGFPRFKMRQITSADGRVVQYRDTRHATGVADPLSNVRDGSLEMHVNPPEYDPDPRHSPWEGMSGATVWCDRRIVGLICEHRQADGLATLTVNPVARWNNRLTERQVHDLSRLIGLPDTAPYLMPAGPGARDMQAYLAAARRAAAHHPYLGPLAGAPALAAVYVRQIADRHITASDGPASLAAEPEDETRYGERLSASEVLAGAGTCVVIGGPGGGKTSLLRTCVDASAGRWLRGLTDTAIPVLVPAAQLVDGPLLDAVAKAASQELKWFGLTTELTADFFRAPAAPEVPWLLMIDGFDEIASPETRGLLLNELATIASEPDSNVRFVIATRPLPVGELDLLGSHVPIYELQRFTDEDVSTVAAAWFKALGLANASDAAARFAAAVARRTRLPELARTPLMAAMLCQLFATAMDQDLPDSRGAIYQEFTDRLFKRLNTPGASGAWTQSDAAFAGYSPQVREQARQVIVDLPELVGYLASERHRNYSGKAIDLISSHPAAQAPPGPSGHEWLGYLDALLRRSGLLAARGDDFVFLHLTLEDYLAARYIGRKPEERASVLRKALRFNRLQPTSSSKWPREDPSFIGFLIDPGTHAPTVTDPALDRVARNGGIHGCRFIATLTLLGTRIPPAVVQHAGEILENTARVRGDGNNWDRIPAAKILADIDRARGLDLLAWLATNPKLQYKIGRGDAVKEIAALDRQRAIEVVQSLTAYSKKTLARDRIAYAFLLYRLDRLRGSEAIESIVKDRRLTSWDRIGLVREFIMTDSSRGAALLKFLIHEKTTSYLSNDLEKSARLLLEVDPAAAFRMLDDLVKHTTETAIRDKWPALLLAEIDRNYAISLLEPLVGRQDLSYSQRSWAESAIAIIRNPRPRDETVSDAAKIQVRSYSGLLDSRQPELVELHRRRLSGKSGQHSTEVHATSSDLPQELLKLDDPRAADLLAGIASNFSDFEFYRVTAAWQLAQIGDPRGADLLEAIARHNDVRLKERRDAAEELAKIDPVRGEKVAEVIAEVPEPEPPSTTKFILNAMTCVFASASLLIGIAFGQRSDVPSLVLQHQVVMRCGVAA
jgi:hypothetical protein